MLMNEAERLFFDNVTQAQSAAEGDADCWTWFGHGLARLWAANLQGQHSGLQLSTQGFVTQWGCLEIGCVDLGLRPDLADQEG